MITNQVKVDANGNWSYQVPSNLEPGTYTVTLKGTDASGLAVTKPVTFTIAGNASVTPALPASGFSDNLFIVLGFVIITLGIVSLKILRDWGKSFEERLTGR